MGKRILACVLVAALAASGCTGMKTRLVMHPDKPPLSGLEAGDTVQIVTFDGRRQLFVIQAIEGDAIIAPSGVRYLAQDIQQLKRREFSVGKTLGLVGGISAALFVVMAIAIASALDDIWTY